MDDNTEIYYKEELKIYISQYLKSNDSDKQEIELIIGRYEKGRVKNNRIQFFHFLDKIGPESGVNIVDDIKNIGIEQKASIRHRKITTDDESTGDDFEYIKKTTIDNIDLPDLFCRLNIKIEEELSEPEDMSQRSLQRRIKRFTKETSFSILDMSIVETYKAVVIHTEGIAKFSLEETPRITYEIELEMKNRRTYTQDVLLDKFIDDYIHYLKIFLDTKLLYNEEELSRFIRTMNKLLDGSEDDRMINTDNFTKPKTFDFASLKSLEVLRRAHTIRTKEKQVYFNYVTYKGDGERKILLISANLGVWMFYGFFYTLISRDVDPRVKLTVLDTEYLNMNDQNIFEILDILFYEGTDIRSYIMVSSIANKGVVNSGQDTFGKVSITRSEYNIRGKDKSSRFDYVVEYINNMSNKYDKRERAFTKIIGNKGISRSKLLTNLKNIYLNDNILNVFYIKPIFPLNKGCNLSMLFFESLSKILDHNEDPEIAERVKTDGLIIFTGNTPYQSGKIEKGFPNTMKWKPLSKFTIDFAVYHGLDEEIPHILKITKTNRDTGVKYHENFKGDDFEMTQVQMDEKYTDGQIFEMYWDIVDEVFKVYRKRFNKDSNSAFDANANWKNINDYISEDILRGIDEEYRLLKKYHNVIKRGLFTENKSSITDKYVLDIGSGRGGDVSKIITHKPKFVFFLEPNEDAHDELQRRLELGKFTRYSIIVSKGQNWKKISKYIMKHTDNEGVDLISMMNSLTFFWESEEDLQSLSNTISSVIKDSAQFIYMLMDGNAIKREYYRNDLNMYEDKIIEVGKAKIEFKEEPLKLFGSRIEFTFPGFVGEKQQEYISHIDMLFSMLEHTKKFSGKYADGEELMSVNDKYISRMYRYGSIEVKRRDPIGEDPNLEFKVVDAKSILMKYQKENLRFTPSYGEEEKSIDLGIDPELNIESKRISNTEDSLLNVIVKSLGDNMTRRRLLSQLSSHLTELTSIYQEDAKVFFGFPYIYWDIFYMERFLKQLEVAVITTEIKSLKDYKDRNYSITGTQAYLKNPTKGFNSNDLLYISVFYDINIYFVEPSRSPGVGVNIYLDQDYSIRESYESGSDRSIVILRYNISGWRYENIVIDGNYIISTDFVQEVLNFKNSKQNMLKGDIRLTFKSHILSMYKNEEVLREWYRIISLSPVLNIMKKFVGSLNQFDELRDWMSNEDILVPYRYYSNFPRYRLRSQIYEHFEFMVNLLLVFDFNYRTKERNEDLVIQAIQAMLEIISETRGKNFINMYRGTIVADLKYRYLHTEESI